MDKLKVFVSHSFDKIDSKVVNKILDVMRRPRFHLEVVTAQHSQSRPFADKIWELIDWADVTFGILTVRGRDRAAGTSYPSHFVVSECSSALGRYRDSDTKTVVGIVEEPIQHSTLGLNVARGDEFPPFNRADILADKTEILEKYLHDLYQRHGARLGGTPTYSYKQRHVRKTVEVYRSGLGIFKNKNIIVINNAQEFIDRGNRVEHRIWLPNSHIALPDFNEMLKVPVKDRHIKPFFFAMLFESKTHRETEQPMEAVLLQQGPDQIRVGLQFPFPVKNSDILQYQYVWGVPGAFYTSEDEQPSDYQEVSLRALHGKIDTVELRVKFERETIYGASPKIFSKSPFVVFSASATGDGTPSEPRDPRATRDSIFEIYEQDTTALTGAMIMKWTPASRAFLDRELSSLASSREAPRRPVSSIKITQRKKAGK